MGADLNRRGFLQLGAGTALLGSGVLAACGGGGGGGIANVTGSVITRWREDPYALGSYSHLTAGAQPLDREAIATPIGDWLFFAGEATARPAPRHRPWRAALGAARRPPGHRSRWRQDDRDWGRYGRARCGSRAGQAR